MRRHGALPLLELISRPGTLEKAWRAVRRRSPRTSPGLDAVTMGEFARSWPVEKAKIRDDLKKGYQFTPYRGQPIKKRKGGWASPYDLKAWRPISIAAIRDRVVQRAILERIWPDIRDHIYTPGSYGGVRQYKLRSGPRLQKEPEEDERRCVRTAAKRIIELRQAGLRWVFETDIENFFPQIDRGRLLRGLFALLRDDSINHLITASLDTSVANAAELGPLSGLWDASRGVPQGGTLSTAMANFYLFQHDKAVTAASFQLVRYVDDLIVLARSEDEARRAHELCRSELAALGLSIHPLGKEHNGRIKTNIRGPGDPFEFLGLTFARNSIKPTRRKLDDLLKRMTVVADTKRSRATLPEVIQQLNWSILGWVKAYDFCNLTDDELRSIDNKAAFLMRRWMKHRGFVQREKQIDSATYKWLGLQAAKSIHLKPLLKRRRKPPK